MEYILNENSGQGSRDFQNESTRTDFEISKLGKAQSDKGDPQQGDKSPVTYGEEFIESDPNRFNGSNQTYISQNFDENENEEEDDDYDYFED